MVFKIEPAKLEQTKARVALVGVAGCGKTYTALITAQELGKKVVVLDTENKSSAKYAQTWPSFGFDVLPMPDYAIKTYIDALDFVSTKYDVVIVDSLSHAWAGRGGALEMAETMKAKHGGNKFAAWGDVTPLQNQLVEIILNYPQHIIATMRMKMEYVLTQDDRGKTSPQKVGLGIVQRDSFEYEFDVVGQMDIEHNLLITKTRCPSLDGFMMHKPDGTFGKVLSAWLNNGDPVSPPPVVTKLELDKPSEKVTTTVKSSDNGGSKPYRFPSQAAENFYVEVQTATGNYYTSPYHLLKVLGQWFNFGDKNLWEEKLDYVTSHARKAREAEQPGLAGVETTVETKVYSED